MRSREVSGANPPLQATSGGRSRSPVRYTSNPPLAAERQRLAHLIEADMSEEQTLYVRLIDGVDCFAPVAACRNPDGTLRLSANSEFDPADTSTLFEFLPGDVVRAEIRAPRPGQAPVTIATQLVSSPLQDRDYWSVLFRLACGTAEPPALDAVRLERVAARVRSEIESAARWHYPSVVEWAMKCGGHASGA